MPDIESPSSPPCTVRSQLYLEHHMRDFLEGCSAVRSEFIDRFRAECDLAKDFVTKLTCHQLKSHLDTRLIFRCLPNIRELTLTFGWGRTIFFPLLFPCFFILSPASPVSPCPAPKTTASPSSWRASG